RLLPITISIIFMLKTSAKNFSSRLLMVVMNCYEQYPLFPNHNDLNAPWTHGCFDAGATPSPACLKSVVARRWSIITGGSLKLREMLNVIIASTEGDMCRQQKESFAALVQYKAFIDAFLCGCTATCARTGTSLPILQQ
ncbi:hypothetical protein ACNDVG_004814, partial [Escherichia coli]